MAGAVGFEPTVHEIKTRCLTTWLCPNVKKPGISYITKIKQFSLVKTKI